jgi:hypothetical protein
MNHLDALSSLRTDAGLLDKVRTTPAKRSQNELFEQKVSFVFGSLRKGNHVTKEKVREVILEQAGGPVASK